jgi:hypothetical protein
MRGSAALRTGVAPGGALAGPWVRDELWRRARAVPSLDLRFAENKSLVDATTGQNLVTFSRASSGTYVDSTGTIGTATTNLLLRSEEFDNAAWTTTRASVSSNLIASPSGTTTADKLIEDATATNTHFVQQSVSVTTGTAYTFSLFVKASERNFVQLVLNGQFAAVVSAIFDLSTGAVGQTTGTPATSAVLLSDGWWRLSITATANATGSTLAQVRVSSSSITATYTGDGTSGIYIWGAQLEAGSSPTSYIPTGATINSAPRFDHNPVTGESLGLLVEEQRANIVLQSQDLATTWGATSASVSTNTTTAPDGTLTADTITASSSTLGRVQQTITFTGDGDKAISVWLKAGTAPTSVLKIDDSTAGFVNRLSITVTWTAGVASAAASNGTLQGVDAFPNGWYRIHGLAVGVVAANTNRYRIEADSTNGTGSVIAWGAQAENGTFATSYIPTTTAAVTRSASLGDLISSAIANNIRSFYVEFRSPAVGTRGVVSLNDNTANERAAVITSGTDPRLVVHDGGVEQANINGGTVSAGVRTRIAVRLNENDFAISINGGAVVTDTSGTLPTVDRLMLGRTQAGEYLNGTIARFTGWSQPLANTALQSITQ